MICIHIDIYSIFYADTQSFYRSDEHLRLRLSAGSLRISRLGRPRHGCIHFNIQHQKKSVQFTGTIRLEIPRYRCLMHQFTVIKVWCSCENPQRLFRGPPKVLVPGYVFALDFLLTLYNSLFSGVLSEGTLLLEYCSKPASRWHSCRVRIQSVQRLGSQILNWRRH